MSSSSRPKPSTSSIVSNRREIAQLIGADKANRRLLSSSEAETINNAARQDRLYLFIGALDALALAKKQKKLLWRTAMSIESRRTSLPESLPVMLASAAPWFGRDTEMPVFADDATRRKAEVHIGTPVVVPDSPKHAAPPAKAKYAPARAGGNRRIQTERTREHYARCRLSGLKTAR